VFNNDDVSKRERTLAASSPAAAACREAVEGVEAVAGVEAVEGVEAATLASIITGLLIVFTASVTPPGGPKFYTMYTEVTALLSCKSGPGLCCILKNWVTKQNQDISQKIIYLSLKLDPTIHQ